MREKGLREDLSKERLVRTRMQRESWDMRLKPRVEGLRQKGNHVKQRCLPGIQESSLG